jgi:DNA polymerase-3 subunit alpha
MKETINYCAIQNYDGRYKFPKLTELYKKLFGYDIEQKHNAESDTLLTAKCFKELLDKGIIELDNVRKDIRKDTFFSGEDLIEYI